MKYLLMMNTMKAGCGGFPGWAKKDFQAHIAFMIGLDKELRASGELVTAEGLTFPDQAKLVRAGKDGIPVTTASFRRAKSFLPAIGSSMFRRRNEPTPSPHTYQRCPDPAVRQ